MLHLKEKLRTEGLEFYRKKPLYYHQLVINKSSNNKTQRKVNVFKFFTSLPVFLLLLSSERFSKFKVTKREIFSVRRSILDRTR